METQLSPEEKIESTVKVMYGGNRYCTLYILDQATYMPNDTELFDRLIYALRMKVFIGKKVMKADRYKTDDELFAKIVAQTQMYEFNITEGNCILVVVSKDSNPADALIVLTCEEGAFRVEEMYCLENSFRQTVYNEIIPKAVMELAYRYDFKSLDKSSITYYQNSITYLKPTK